MPIIKKLPQVVTMLKIQKKTKNLGILSKKNNPNEGVKLLVFSFSSSLLGQGTRKIFC